MPFTVTHIAAVVPIAWMSRWRLPFSALVIGSMICDIPVFFPWLLDYQAMHSFIGVLTHCVPVGMVAYVLFHLLFKQPLCQLLPEAVTMRLARWIERPIDFSAWNMLLVVICLAIGSSTHIVWDAFTHASRWGVKLVPGLNEVAIAVGHRSMVWYEVLQHGSTVIVLPILVALGMRWVHRLPVASGQDALPVRLVSYIPLFVFTGLLLGLVAIHSLVIHWRYPHADLVMIVRDSVRLLTVTVLVCFAFYSGAWHAMSRRRRLLNEDS